VTLLDWVGLFLCAFSACAILLGRDWRWNIGFMAALYLGTFWLVQISWTIPLASVKLVSGWMACALLALAHNQKEEEISAPSSWPQGRLFRLATIGLVLIVSFISALSLGNWLNMSQPTAWGGLLLIGFGLLLTGITNQPFSVIIGLLIALSGFEIIYAAVESSSLVTGLLSIITLGLALVGAYFLVHQGRKVEQ
jgi:hypothetical protein